MEVYFGVTVLRQFFYLIINLFLFCLLPLSAQENDPWAKLDNEEIQNEGWKLGRKALTEIHHNISLTQSQMQQLAQEISDLEKDQHSLSEALVASAVRSRKINEQVREREQQLANLLTQKRAIEQVLIARQQEVGITLAVLERMSLKPPPAIVAHPNDALQMVRSSSLMGSVMAELRTRAQLLRADLGNIAELERVINEEKAEISTDLHRQHEEATRLLLLLEEKKTAHEQSGQQLALLQEQTATLTHKAQSLQELIADVAAKDNQSLVEEAASDQSDRANSLPLLAINNHFARQRGTLPYPVEGIKMQSFGKEIRGELYETSPGAMITTPVDGVVRFAGVFRSYGNMLIIDVGQNYHLVFAGMGQIYVQQGQILLAGEPVAAMSSYQLAEGEAEITPIVASTLYVEIRKDGHPIDPAPWWAT